MLKIKKGADYNNFQPSLNQRVVYYKVMHWGDGKIMQHGSRPEAANDQLHSAASLSEESTITTNTTTTTTTTREKQDMVSEHHDESDSRLDAFAATTLILIAVCTALFWVAGH